MYCMCPCVACNSSNDISTSVTWLSAMYSTSLYQHTAGLTMTEWISECVSVCVRVFCVKVRELHRDRMIKHGCDSCVKWVFDKAGYLKQILIIPRDHHILAQMLMTSQNRALQMYTLAHATYTHIHPQFWADIMLVIWPKSIRIGVTISFTLSSSSVFSFFTSSSLSCFQISGSLCGRFLLQA